MRVSRSPRPSIRVCVDCAMPVSGSKVRCSSSSRPSPISRQSLSVQTLDQAVAVIELDHELAARAQHAPDRGQHLDVLLVAEVAERGEEVEGGVEARLGERQLAVVRARQLRPARAACAPAGLVEQRLRPVDADRAEARAGQRERVAAEAAGHVEHVRARLDAREPGGGQRVDLRLRVTLLAGVGAQVEVTEERVPGLGRARPQHAAEATRRRPAGRPRAPRP